MCRIAGAISPRMQKEELEAFVSNMCYVQKHGGPDDGGIYTNSTFNGVLGHCRLSIIDLSNGGHQPMLYLNGRYSVSYNGEIYNYQALREELKQHGYQFTTQSDTEVILAAYDKWGTGSFKRFSGMFAFALCDHHKNEVLLVRDSAGIKPLYYANTSQLFAFASEVRALKQLPPLQETNNNWQVYFMAYGHLPEPVTTQKEVRPLAKGTYLKYDIPTGSSSTHTYERPGYFEKIGSREEAVELVRTTLTAAVKRHLISDAPIGVFLSGGLDSGVIALLADQSKNLNTVSVYFENKEYSEKKFQDDILGQLSCIHKQFLITEDNFHQSLPGIIQDMDQPCCDGINTWYISKYARESGLKAVLSGIGGDELFGGYPSFHRMRAANMLSHLPGKVLRSGRFAGAKKLKRLCYLSIPGAVGKYLFLRGHFIPSDIAAYLGMEEKAVWDLLEATPVQPDIHYLSPGNQASWLEANMYMQNQLLRDADVMSMAHGLEIRVPFLDKAFQELVFSIRSDVKYSGAFGKQLLIDSFRDVLPESIWNRPKMGFSFPFKEWFANEQYAHGKNAGLADWHRQFSKGQLHWSQFFTIMLLSQNFNE